MSFQGHTPSVSIDNSIDHYVLVSHLTLIHDANENSQKQKLTGEPLRPELNLTVPPEHVFNS